MKLPPLNPDRTLYTPYKKKGEWEQFCDDCKFIFKVIFYPFILLATCLNKWFLNLDSVFGNADYTDYSQHLQKPSVVIPLSQLQKNCKEHDWAWDWSQKNNWFMDTNGKPSGPHLNLDDCIKSTQQNPSHNETSLAMLQDWKKSGCDIVFCSRNRYHCKKCDLIYMKDFYTNPYWKNLCSVLYVPKKYETQPLPVTSYRREIAVEPVKIYIN